MTRKYREYFDDLTLVKKCMPTFFERFDITVDGKRIEGNDGDLDVKLYPTQTVVLTDTSGKGEEQRGAKRRSAADINPGDSPRSSLTPLFAYTARHRSSSFDRPPGAESSRVWSRKGRRALPIRR